MTTRWAENESFHSLLCHTYTIVLIIPRKVKIKITHALFLFEYLTTRCLFHASRALLKSQCNFFLGGGGGGGYLNAEKRRDDGLRHTIENESLGLREVVFGKRVRTECSSTSLLHADTAMFTKALGFVLWSCVL